MTRPVRVVRDAVLPSAVGASEVPAVLGCDPWTTPLALYRRKLGLAEPQPDSDAMAIGRALEGPVVDLARQRIPLPIRRNRATFLDPELRLFATPDAFVGSDRLLEAKVVGLRTASDWQDGALPCRVKLQVQAQLLVLRRSVAFVVGLVGTQLELVVVEADPELQAGIRQGVASFLELLDARREPDPLTYGERWAKLLDQVQASDARDVLAGTRAQELGDRLLEIRADQDALEDEARELRAELLEELVSEGGNRLVGTGWTATVQTRAGSVDWRKVAELQRVAIDVLAPLAPDPAAVTRTADELPQLYRSAPSYPFVLRSKGSDHDRA
jgi:predicted phage-related endonuclease